MIELRHGISIPVYPSCFFVLTPSCRTLSQLPGDKEMIGLRKAVVGINSKGELVTMWLDEDEEGMYILSDNHAEEY